MRYDSFNHGTIKVLVIRVDAKASALAFQFQGVLLNVVYVFLWYNCKSVRYDQFRLFA